MTTNITNSEKLYQYLDKTGADFVVDKNPSLEKVTRIREAIQRKNDLFERALDRFKTSTNHTVVE